MTVNSAVGNELGMAERARQAGNEGRARVCARRAAGIAARDFLTRRGIFVPGKSAYSALQALLEFPALPLDMQTAARHLTMQVNLEFDLPPGIDLIADSRRLIGGLD
jgi:hypothetical protein